MTGLISEPAHYCQMTCGATVVTHHSHVFSVRIPPGNTVHWLRFDSYFLTIGVQLLLWMEPSSLSNFDQLPLTLGLLPGLVEFEGASSECCRL